MFSSFSRKKNQKGQGLVEYALILVLVAIVVIAVLVFLGPIIGNMFGKVNSSLSGVGGGSGEAAAVVAPAGGCEVKHADGYATALGDPNGQCYSPSASPHYYNP